MIKNKTGVEVKELIGQSDFEILHVHNEKWTGNKILHPRVQKPGLALAGYLKYLDKDRIQIFGNTEIGYLEHLDRAEFEKLMNEPVSNGQLASAVEISDEENSLDELPLEDPAVDTTA